jgi:hypothetical protein
MLVTLNVKGPPRVVLFTPFPDNQAIANFRKVFRESLNDKILVAEIESRSLKELCDQLLHLSERYDYTALLVLSHGTQNHRILFQDPNFPLPERINDVEFLGDYILRSSYFRSAFDDKLLLLAACFSGDKLIADPLLHTGMALHVVTPDPSNPKLTVAIGAQAMAQFLNILSNMNKDTLTPEDLSKAEIAVNAEFQNIIKLWQYEASPEFIEEVLKGLKKYLR